MKEIIEIKTLIYKLNKYAYEYYTLDNPSVSDEIYDGLFDKLTKLEKETGIILSNSPTQRVGYEVKKELSKIKHKYTLKSLDKTKDINALEKFLKGREGVLMLKLDGLTNELVYRNGELVEASTRGNGEIGEDILHNVKTYTNIPLTIPCKDEVRIVGEAIITYDIFEKINKNGEFKNPRNTVAGSVRQLDSKICKVREVKFISYNVFDKDFKTKTEQFNWLRNQGFQVVQSLRFSKILLTEEIDKLRSIAGELYVPIDGLVLTFNDLEYAKTLGNTSHHPLHSIAYKFNEDVETTILRDVEYQVGRSGVITPIAVFDEVELAGTTVSRASLHNISIIKKLQLGLLDEICVVKKNEIIPQVTENLTRSNILQIPAKCPECGHPTEIKYTDSAEFLMCSNPNCKAKLVQKISHYVSRNAMNIEGLSEATISKLIDRGFIKSISDLYSLDKYKKEIIKMEGFGQKSYNNLITAIEKSKQCKLENFIFGLGIEGVGLSTAKILSKFVDGKTMVGKLYRIIDTPISDLIKMKDMGDITANNVYKWFKNKENFELLNQVVNHLNFIEEEKILQGNRLEGLTFVVTGDVYKFKNRKELQSKIESLGGKVSGSVSSKTNYLINNDTMSNSSKNKKAKDLNIPIISEDEFIEMTGEV